MQKKKSRPTVESHPRNYFQKTNIGSTRRKFGYFTDVNWKPQIDEQKAREYCVRFVQELIEQNGYLDAAFSTTNPIFRSYVTKNADVINMTLSIRGS